MQHLGQTLIILHKFANCRSIYTSDKPLHSFQQKDWVLPKTRKIQGPEWQLVEQRSDKALFPEAHGSQALDPPHRDKMGIT